jgi:hypothetical protein
MAIKDSYAFCAGISEPDSRSSMNFDRIQTSHEQRRLAPGGTHDDMHVLHSLIDPTSYRLITLRRQFVPRKHGPVQVNGQAVSGEFPETAA